MKTNGLIERLQEIQGVLGSTDREFARRLGITHSYWVMIRNGTRRPGRKFIVGVITGFPELEDEAMTLLRTM